VIGIIVTVVFIVGLPAPIQLEAFPMPRDYGRRFVDFGYTQDSYRDLEPKSMMTANRMVAENR